LINNGVHGAYELLCNVMPAGLKNRLVVACDSASRLSEAGRWLNAYQRDAEILVLAPSREAGDDFVRIAAQSSGARFGLMRSTLERLASTLASPILASKGRAPLSGLSLVAISARAVHLLLADQKLSYFAPVARRPGFAPAVTRTIEELRMNGVGLDVIEQLPRGGPDLARLAEQIERELVDAGLADRAERFAAAIESAEGDKPPHPVTMPLLLLDLPVASEREAALLTALVRRAPETFATAARGDSRTLSYLERALECKSEDLSDRTHYSSLASLRSHLFEESKPESMLLDSSVTLRSWPGEGRECVEIVRRIQSEASQGAPFDRIAVFLRSPAEYRLHLEEAFTRAAIPAYFARGTNQPDPSGRALLALLACAAEKLSARRFAEYISLAQVPDPSVPDAPRAEDSDWAPPEYELLPEGLQVEAVEPPEDVETVTLLADPNLAVNIEGSLRAPWRWEQLMVEAAVIGGRDRWERRLAGLETELLLKRKELAEEDETRAALIDHQLRDLRHLREFALPLIGRLAELPGRATWGEWLDHLQALARKALRSPEAVLATITELEPMSPVGPIGLDEVLVVIAPRLRDLTVRPPRRRYGQVFVGSTDDARGLSFDVVFVPGLAEKLFPRKIVDDPILLDEQRRELPELITQQGRVTLERLALRLALGAARKRAHLSYPRIDVQQSRPRVPSFYGLEVLRAAEGRLPGFDKLSELAESISAASLGWPAPGRPEAAIDEAEYDLALLALLIDADPETTVGTAHYLVPSNPHLGRALRTRARRWLRRWTPADGLVEPDELAAEALARHQLSARSFSPTALQNYAACPYRFFLQAIHRLQPREEPVAIEIVDPLTRGALFHEVQYEVLTMLREAGALPVTFATLKSATEAVDDVLDRVAYRYREKLAPAIPRVWEDSMNAIRADLREWLRRYAESDDGWVPYRFELSFGLADRDRPGEDPASVPDPVSIIRDGLKLRGSIDLVERHITGKLRATDHKTGKARASTGVVIGGGQHLQPVLYALASEKLLEEPVESGRLYYCTSTGGYEERIVALDDFSRGYAGLVVENINRAMEEGFLPAAPEKDTCKWCDYRPVCGPNEEFRVTQKPKKPLEELKRLRELP
jgi:RecB family exonuclease